MSTKCETCGREKLTMRDLRGNSADFIRCVECVPLRDGEELKDGVVLVTKLTEAQRLQLAYLMGADLFFAARLGAEATDDPAYRERIDHSLIKMLSGWLRQEMEVVQAPFMATSSRFDGSFVTGMLAAATDLGLYCESDAVAETQAKGDIVMMEAIYKAWVGGGRSIHGIEVLEHLTNPERVAASKAFFS